MLIFLVCDLVEDLTRVGATVWRPALQSWIMVPIVFIKELIFFIDIGYIDGFKNALTKAEKAASLNPHLCADLHRNLLQLDLIKIHSQLTTINNEI